MFKAKGTYTVKYTNRRGNTETIGECAKLSSAKKLAVDHARELNEDLPKRWTWQGWNGMRQYYWREHNYTIEVPDPDLFADCK